VLPYFEQPTVPLGPVTLHAFGLIVAAAVLIGFELGRRRFARLGIDTKEGERFGWYVVGCGLLGAHLFSLTFYFPEQLLSDPLAVLRVWENLSSFGGVVGGLLGARLYFRRAGSGLTSRQRWLFLDVVAFVFMVSLTIGRVACTLAHDHPGTITNWPLAISLQRSEAQAYIRDVYAAAGRSAELPAADVMASLGFHDLGWYEFLYLATFVVPAFILADRRPRAPGTFVLMFTLLYMPVRFGLDFLRVADATYGGLTPAQWTAIVLLAFIPLSARARRAH
jgi:phosphatidylglycerol:prolipoprotein diacylglycerol transferase